MLISDKHRLILMLPEKCGSSTLQKRLASIHDVTEFGLGHQYSPELNKTLSKHVSIKDARRLKAFKIRSHYLKACFVRNPYDRAYSWFHWNIKTVPQKIKLLEERRRNTGKLNEEETTALGKAQKRLDLLEKLNYDFEQFITVKHKRLRPTHRYTHHWRMKQVNFIGRVETFEACYQQLCKRINFKPPSFENANIIGTQHINKANEGEKPEYLNKYSKAALAVINRAYARDFKIFNYKTYTCQENELYN